MLAKSTLLLSLLSCSTLGLLFNPWQDPAAVGQGQQDPRPQDPRPQDSGRQDSGRQDSRWQDSGPQDNGQQDNGPQDSGRQDSRLPPSVQQPNGERSTFLPRGSGTGNISRPGQGWAEGPSAGLRLRGFNPQYTDPPSSANRAGLRLSEGFNGIPNLQNPLAMARFPEANSPKWQQLRNRIAMATGKLKSATGEDERNAAKSELSIALSDDYDARMDEYQVYLDDLESKLAEMKAKLQRRRQAKDDMVRLRLQVVEAEADELGWPTSLGGMPGFGPGWYFSQPFSPQPPESNVLQ